MAFQSTQPPDLSPVLDNSSSIKPVRVYWETIAPTQAIFYDSNKFPRIVRGQVTFWVI